MSSKLTLVAWCQSCVPGDDVKYDWHLWENLNGRYERVLMSTESQENGENLVQYILWFH